MVDMATKITKDTLLPLALVITIVSAAWFLATDRANAISAIDQHEKRITTIEQDVKCIKDGIHRIEMKLGTAP